MQLRSLQPCTYVRFPHNADALPGERLSCFCSRGKCRANGGARGQGLSSSIEDDGRVRCCGRNEHVEDGIFVQPLHDVKLALN
eukprot:SAG31_NODE_687_length_12813_cov_2.597216_11_plen_83_part_00